MNPVQRLRKTGNGTPPNLERLITDFVRWAAAETDAKTIGEAIARANSDGGPLEPWEHLASFEIGEATDDLQHPYAIIADWRAKLDEREIKIFDSRIAAEPATATLQEVGDEFGLTRERIRQIELGVQEQLASLVRSQTGAPIRWRIENAEKGDPECSSSKPRQNAASTRTQTQFPRLSKSALESRRPIRSCQPLDRSPRTARNRSYRNDRCVDRRVQLHRHGLRHR